MNEEEQARYITELLDGTLIKDYHFEQYGNKDNEMITSFSMESKSGWKVSNREVWQE